MFKLHIYNPEHDMALARNDDFFTPPKAARLTRQRFGHLPALWADDGDWVLVDEPERAISEAEKLNGVADVRFVTVDDLRLLTAETMPAEVLPWGWDRLVVKTLLRANPLFASLVPSAEQLEDIRRMSSREFVAEELLPRLVATDDCLIGEMTAFRGSVEELQEKLKNSGSIVLKSPWSCSGRGVHFVDGALEAKEIGWVKNVLAEQGCIMIEPQYNKVVDFAMEFWAGKSGVEYRGLNVFETRSGAYISNVEGTQEEKFGILCQYVSPEVIERLGENILRITTELFRNRYEGPFGIDMMICPTAPKGGVRYYEPKCTGKAKVHPCVEMNLRRTMGQL